jgi:hypothetical protein
MARAEPPGCHRCRQTGRILVLLQRLEHPTKEEAVRCLCALGRTFTKFAPIDRYIDGWAEFGATVTEWPTIRQRAEC